MATATTTTGTMLSRRPLLALAAMAGVNIIWGAAFPVMKPALETIPPFTFNVLRFAVALAVLLPLTWASVVRLLRGPERSRLLLMGMTGFGAAQVSQMLALSLSPASDLALIATTTPLWIAVMAWLWLREPFRRRTWLGFAVAICGLVLIVWPQGDAAVDPGRRIVGDLVFLICGLAFAAYNVLGKGVLVRQDPLPVTAAACLVGTIAVVPFAVFELASGASLTITPAGVGAVAYTGLLVTVLGFWVLLWAYRHTSAARVAITMYLQPLAGVLLAWQLLGEPLGAMFLAGSAAVLAGVALVTTGSR